MSESMISTGYFGRLKTPVGNYQTPEWEEKNEALHEAKTDMELNYDGTMIFLNSQIPSYEADGLLFPKPNGAAEFRDRCKELGYDVDPVKHYACHWHNGGDSPMSMATLEEVFGE